MNDLELLQCLGDSLDPPTGTPPAQLRERVLTGVHASDGRGRRRGYGTGWRLRWRLGAGAAAAAAVAGALVLGQSAYFTGAAPPATGTKAGTQAGTPAGGPASTAAPQDAAGILRLAAQRTVSAPAPHVRPNQFVYVESVVTYLNVPPGKPVYLEGPYLNRSWLSVDGTRDGATNSRKLSGGAWSNGSIPGCRRGRQAGPIDRPGTTQSCTADPGYLAGLPTDATAMLAYLYHADSSDTYTAALPADERAVTRAAYVLYVSQPAPAVQAAVFEALAQVPGVSVELQATDVAGRHGVGVVHTGRDSRVEFIFDPSTYAYMGTNNTLLRRPVAIDAQTVWTLSLIARQAILHSGVVDRAGQVPATTG